MTASRLARAGRSRFFIGIAVLLLMIGFVAIFHSSQQQLDESRELRLRCERQQEALNSRMQAIVEHKFRCEKSLENERKDHLETKQNFEQKTKEQKDIHANAAMESKVRFDSLQQHYKLLQSEDNDLKEECSKTKQSQLEQINGLERKVKSMQTQLIQAKSQRDKDVEHWKAKYESLENTMKHDNPTIGEYDKQKLINLENLVKEYKTHCAYIPITDQQQNDHYNSISQPEHIKATAQKDFREQIAVSDDIYKIPIKIIPKPLVNSDIQNNIKDDNKEVLQQPPPLNMPIKSSTAPTDLKTPESSNKMAIPMASVASPTSEKIKRSSTQANDGHKERSGKSKQLPMGVAPVPENFEELIKNVDNGSNNNNNRYANVVEELSGKKDDTEQENVAHEIKDNDFNLADEKNESKDHLQEVLDNVNNAAEEDTNNFFDANSVGRGPNNKKDNADEDDVEVIGNKHGKDAIMDGDDKLINEVVGDQGKEPAFPDGMHLEEGNEEDEDEDDYSNPAARQQEGVAVRN